jgi:hypothetical protein
MVLHAALVGKTSDPALKARYEQQENTAESEIASLRKI